MKVSVFKPVSATSYPSRFTSSTAQTIVFPPDSHPLNPVPGVDNKRLGYTTEQAPGSSPSAPQERLPVFRNRFLDHAFQHFLTSAQRDGKSGLDYDEFRRTPQVATQDPHQWPSHPDHRYGRASGHIKNHPESIHHLPEPIRNIAIAGREFLVNQALQRRQYPDDDVKLLMTLAFSRAMQSGNVPVALAQVALKQLEPILLFPRMAQHLQSVDALGQQLFKVFSKPAEGVTQPSPSQPTSFPTKSPLKVEFMDEAEEANLKIIHSIPVKPAGHYAGLNYEA